MDIERRGFAPIAIALIVAACIIVIGGVFYYLHHNSSSGVPPVQQPQPPVTTSTVPTSTATSTPITSYRSYLTPSSGPVGTVVTIHASGFAPTGNQVTLDGMVGAALDDLSSPDGKTLTFTVPSSLGPNCKPDQACPMYEMLVEAGTFSVSVITKGVTQAVGSFTVMGGGVKIPQ